MSGKKNPEFANYTSDQFKSAIVAQKAVIKKFGPANATNGKQYWDNKYRLAELFVQWDAYFPGHEHVNEE